MVTEITTSLVQGEQFKAEFSGVAADVTAVTLYLRSEAASGVAPNYVITCANESGAWIGVADTGAFGDPPAPWVPGAYAIEAWATATGGVRSLIARARLDVQASAQYGGAGFSPVSEYEKIVRAIESHLAANGQDPTWRRYRINNRELERYSVSELLRLLAHYKRLVAIEKRKAKGQSVLGPDICFRI